MTDGYFLPYTLNVTITGYCVDLLDEIGKICNFDFIIQPNANQTYGSYNAKDNTWSGMIGELIRQVSDRSLSRDSWRWTSLCGLVAYRLRRIAPIEY